MWAGRVRQVSPGTAGERESRKGSLDPFPVVAKVLAEVFRPQLCETPMAPCGPCRLRGAKECLSMSAQKLEPLPTSSMSSRVRERHFLKKQTLFLKAVLGSL